MNEIIDMNEIIEESTKNAIELHKKMKQAEDKYNDFIINNRIDWDDEYFLEVKKYEIIKQKMFCQKCEERKKARKKRIQKIKKYCKNYELIENYAVAEATDFTFYVVHHRNGLDKTKKELIAEGLYYDRPPEELIFLTDSQHAILHKYGNFAGRDFRKK